jgi:hypothetical protein
MNDKTTAPAMLSLYDGSMHSFDGTVLVRVHNNQGQQSPPSNRKGPAISISVPFLDGPGDFYAVSVSADGYQQTGLFLYCKS